MLPHDEKDIVPISLDIASAHVLSITAKKFVSNDEYTNRNIIFLAPVAIRAFGFTPGAWYPVAFIASCHSGADSPSQIVCPELNCVAQVQPLITNTFVSLPEATADQASASFYGLDTSPSVLSHVPADTAHVFTSSSTPAQRGCPGTTQSLATFALSPLLAARVSSYLAAVAVLHLLPQSSVAVPLSAHIVLSPTLATPRGNLATMRALRSGRSSTYTMSLSKLECSPVYPVMTRTPTTCSAITSHNADVSGTTVSSTTHKAPQPVHLASVRHPLTRTAAASLLARTLGPLGATPSPLSCAAHAEATAVWHAGEWWRAESIYGWASSSELRVEEEERHWLRKDVDGESEDGEDGLKSRRGRTHRKKAKSTKKDKGAGPEVASPSTSADDDEDTWDEDDQETAEYDASMGAYLSHEEEDEDSEVELDASGVREVLEAVRKAEEKARKEVSARKLARATRMLLLGRCEAEVEDAPATLSMCPAEDGAARDRNASTSTLTADNACVSSSPYTSCSLCLASDAAPAMALFSTHPSSLPALLIALRDRAWAVRANASVTYRRVSAAFPLQRELTHTPSVSSVSSSSHAAAPQLSHAPVSLLRSVASSWAARASRTFHAHDALLESVCSHALSQALATPTAHADAPRHQCTPRVLPVLISGPSGCGKSAFARAIAEAAPGPRVFLDAAQLTSGVRGEAAAELTAALRRAQPEGASALLNAPMGVWRVTGACVGVAVLDDVDALSPVGEDEEEEGRHTRNEQELLAVLSALLRTDQCSLCSAASEASAVPVNLPADNAVAVAASAVIMRPVLLVLMTTSRPHRLPAVLAQPTLAPLRVSLDTLAVQQRVQLLSALLARIPLADSRGRLLEDSNAPSVCSLSEASSTPSSSAEAARVIAAIAGSLHGYTGADVSRIVTEACLAALNRVVGADSDAYARVSRHFACRRGRDNALSAFAPHARAAATDILDDVPSFALQPCDWAAAFARIPGPAALAASGLALALDAADTPIEELLGSLQSTQVDTDDVGTPATSVSSSVATALTHAPGVDVRFVDAPKRVFPSAFDMLGGMEQPLRTLQHWLLEPLRAAASGQPAALPSGILLHGPPGSGKTTMSLCIAKACRLPIITANAATLVNKLVGGGEKAIRRLFDTARASAPCILLLDNIEAIAGSAKHAIDAQIDAQEAGDQSPVSASAAPPAPSTATSSPFAERTRPARRQFDKSGGRVKPPKPAASATATTAGSSAPERVSTEARGDIAPHAPSRLVTALLSELDDTLTASMAGLLGAWDGHTAARITQEGVSVSAPSRPTTAQQRVIVLATTRAPHTLPSHLLRPGRLGLHVSLPLPSLTSRWEILAKRAARMPFAVRGPRATAVDERFPCVRALLYWVSRRMDGASAADLQAVVSGAAMHSIREIKARGDVSGDGKQLMAHPTILPHDLIHALRSLGFLRATDDSADSDLAADEARLCLEEAAAIERVIRGGEEWYGPAGDEVHEVSSIAAATAEPVLESALPELPLPTDTATASAAVELSVLDDAVLLWGCSDSDSVEEDDDDEEEENTNATDRLAVLRARRRIPT